MSKWYEVEDGDIDIDHEEKEVSFFVHNDGEGSVYLTLSFEQIIGISANISV